MTARETADLRAALTAIANKLAVMIDDYNAGEVPQFSARMRARIAELRTLATTPEPPAVEPDPSHCPSMECQIRGACTRVSEACPTRAGFLLPAEPVPLTVATADEKDTGR